MTFRDLRRISWFAVTSFAVSFAALSISASQPNAAEDGKGFYLLGSNTTLAGISPPPGTYLTNWKYFYTGDASGAGARGVALDGIGATASLQADVDVDANVFIDIPLALWVTPHKVLGGHFGLGLLLPFGWQDISADANALATLTLPDGRTFQRGRRFNVSDDTFSFGDPVGLAQLGWHRGNWHWRVAGLLNIPIGAYDQNSIANMGFNRWAVDTHASVTWLDTTRGLEASTTAGFTFNGNNPDTDYRTGTEFHVEFALMQSLSKSFGIGLAGFHYQQVTGDSGAGATLGDFKGRVTALGPNINYNFQLHKIPVSTSLRWYHEFNAENRLEGDSIYLMATIPLGPARR